MTRPQDVQAFAVLFDCDGVLVDASDEIEAMTVAVSRAVADREPSAQVLSMAADASADQLLEQMFGDREQRERARAAAARHGDQHLALVRMADGVVPALAELSSRYRLGVVTNRGASVVAILARLELERFFEVVVHSELPVRAKPSGDGIALALAQLGVTPRRAVYVGDAPCDRMAAAEAGVGFVGIGPRSGARHVVPAIGEVVAPIEDLMRHVRANECGRSPGFERRPR